MTGSVSLPPQEIAALERHLIHIYGDSHALEPLLAKPRAHIALHPPRPRRHWSGRDILLITYGDTILSPDLPPLILHALSRGNVSRLIGAPNALDLVESTGHTRSINRCMWRRRQPEALLANPASPQAGMFRGMIKLLRIHREAEAMDPDVPQENPDLGPGPFAVLRRARWCRREVLALHNVGRCSQR